MARSAQTGLTLIELMTVILIASILMVVAVPGMRSLSERSQQLNAIGDISSMLARARSEAAALYQPITVCSSSDGASCTGDLDWQPGWLMFVDTNSNQQLDEGETIIQVGPPLPVGSELKALYFGGYDEATVLTFKKGGMPETAGSFRYCFKQASILQAVNLSVSGQTRIAVDTNGDGKLENNAGTPIPECQ